jgi:hypothetical protein
MLAGPHTLLRVLVHAFPNRKVGSVKTIKGCHRLIMSERARRSARRLSHVQDLARHRTHLLQISYARNASHKSGFSARDIEGPRSLGT